MAEPTRQSIRGSLRFGGVLGFVGGFLLAYQNSSGKLVSQYLNILFLITLAARFWGWKENAREQELDLAELSQRAKEGKPLYGESDQPVWVQNAAHSNSAFSQLKFRELVYSIRWFI